MTKNLKINALGAEIKNIYKPKYIVLNLFLGAVYYGLFIYLAYIQGGGAVMLRTSAFLIFGLVATSSIALTIAIYSIANTRKNSAKVSGTATSFSTLVAGTGLCGCTTTFPAAIAAGVGVSSSGVYTLSAFLKNNNPYIFSLLMLLNVIIIGYYLDRFSKPKCKLK